MLQAIPTPAASQPLARPMGSAYSVGGLVNVVPLKTLQDQERQKAEQANNAPVLTGLASHVRKCWQDARDAKRDIELRMLRNLRSRRGEYSPDELAKLKEQDAQPIFMMVTSVKCRAAASWLRDVMLGTGTDKPWSARPTPNPELDPTVAQEIHQRVYTDLMEFMMITGQEPPMDALRGVLVDLRDEALEAQRVEAREAMDRLETKMEDQLLEGGWMEALSAFIDDITTFPTAFVKGPVIRNKKRLQWVQGQEGWTMDVAAKLSPEWERVDPFNLYPAPWATSVHDGYLIERHQMTRQDLHDLIGVDGYDEGAIRAVLDEHGRKGLREWLWVDLEKADAEGRDTLRAASSDTIDALQYWGSIQGRQLREWGLSEEEVPDELKEYQCEVWLVGNWVIKASLNYHPLGWRPYYGASFEMIPGSVWGNAVADLVADVQSVCNSSARALVRNMGVASGPQVVYNVDRLPAGEDITEMFPWKVWQVTQDPLGSTAPAVDFFQPSSNAAELMAIFEKFSLLADEYSGIPRYMTGDNTGGTIGRTSSGMAMMMSNAGKAIKQVVSNIDLGVIAPVIQRLHFHNMRYGDDPDLKGDPQLIARGAISLQLKEQAAVRRNEFLQLVLMSPLAQQIVGLPGAAALLREGARSLDMDVDKIVPNERQLQQQQMLMMMQQAAMMGQAQGQPGPQGGKTMSRSGQELDNGAPVADNFSPKRAPAKGAG